MKLTDPDGNQTIDPEIFKQMIMSDPLIQLIKGIFEGDEGAKYAVKMGTIEIGIKAGGGLNNIGTGLIIFGVMDGNPAMVVVGGAIDTAGDITKLSFMIIKAVDTKSANDINAAMEEGIKFASSELSSKIAKSTVENSCAKKYYSGFIKSIFGESSKLKEIDKKAGEQILSKMVGESNKFIINMVFKKENE